MDLKKAIGIIKDEDLCFEKMDFKEKNTVRHGLQILEKYEDDVHPQFDHDVIWASDFEKTVSQMTEEDFYEMIRLGWGYNENNECWYHY